MKAGNEDLFRRGVELFNQGRFFESHEVWEQVWLRSSGQEKLFYQGMIQAAAAILHAQRGNSAGGRTLFGKAMDKLGPLPPRYLGIALDDFRRSLEDFFQQQNTGRSPSDRLFEIRYGD